MSKGKSLSFHKKESNEFNPAALFDSPVALQEALADLTKISEAHRAWSTAVEEGARSQVSQRSNLPMLAAPRGWMGKRMCGHNIGLWETYTPHLNRASRDAAHVTFPASAEAKEEVLC